MGYENKRLKDDITLKEEKLILLYNFIINMQHTILNRPSNLSLLQNSDCSSLRSRILEIEDELHTKVIKNERFLIGKLTNEFEQKSPLLSLKGNIYNKILNNG